MTLAQILHTLHQPKPSSWKESKATMVCWRETEKVKGHGCNRFTEQVQLFIIPNVTQKKSKQQMGQSRGIPVRGRSQPVRTCMFTLSPYPDCTISAQMRSYRGNITGYLVLLRGLAMQGSGADPAGVHLNAHVVCEVHVGSFQKGETVL